MFVAKMPHNTFINIVRTIAHVIDTTVLTCSTTGMSLQEMDISHASLVQLLIGESCFETYQCEKNAVFGLSFHTMKDLLKDVDSVTLKSCESGLSLLCENDEGVMEKKMALVHVDPLQICIPEMEWSTVHTVSSSLFKQVIDELSEIALDVHLIPKQDHFTLGVFGKNGFETRQVVPQCVNWMKNVYFAVSLYYVKKFCKAACVSDTVTLCMSKEAPLLMEFPLSHGYLRYYLAPKIFSESENPPLA